MKPTYKLLQIALEVLEGTSQQVNEDDMYLHRAISKYVTPSKTDKLKKTLQRVYTQKDRNEHPKFIPLTKLASRIKNKIKTNPEELT